MKPFLDGILTGLFLQLALGPVFFYISGITLDSSYINSFSAVLAVTAADYIFIILSLMGISRFLNKDRNKQIFGLLGSIMLIIFGLLMLQKGLVTKTDAVRLSSMAWTPFSSFASTFILTMSSPLTIVFWGSIFSAKATEKNYLKQQLAVFGLGAGAATFIFLSLAMLVLSLFKSSLPDSVVQILNSAVGVILVIYGVSRSIRSLSDIQQNKTLFKKKQGKNHQ